jgi:hypothetical protein
MKASGISSALNSKIAAKKTNMMSKMGGKGGGKKTSPCGSSISHIKKTVYGK